ncbi:hypothetical protein NX794_32935 [Streptomyces sp. LP11]|uniref:Uncharacterized protein n=1 Tax=Streptomyces pyxinicus TaxID=2970331 RepID=A0ABT2BBU9_9ACTN|nr:hypothetical protein [Streptomyces sp. LP11]MCS0605977.1 hypothetical protein [Streptomyces sp. LP11]
MDEPTLKASQVCGATLDSSAVKALQRMGGTEEFSESPGSTATEQSGRFSVKRAASTLHDEVTERNQCDVFKAGDKTGHSLIQVDFSATQDHPGLENSPGQEGENTFYPIGVYAKHTAATAPRSISRAQPEKPARERIRLRTSTGTSTALRARLPTMRRDQI